MLTAKKLSVVVVVFRDEGNIRELYRRCTDVLRKVTSRYEIIFVNDGSPDKSEEILENLAKADSRLAIIEHSRNFGAQNAFCTGLEYARGDAVILMDGDLQDPPELIVDFVKRWIRGYQVVYGIRRKREKSLGRINQFFYHFFYVFFNKLSYVHIPLDAGDFSLIDRIVVSEINKMPERGRFIRGLRAWVGFKQTGVDYVRDERFWGISTNNFWKNLRWVREAVFSFSFQPLEWVFYLASVSFIVSLSAITLYIIYYFLHPGATWGMLAIFVSLLFFGSVQLIVLSIICEYLRKIFEEVKGRPTAIIKKVVNIKR